MRGFGEIVERLRRSTVQVFSGRRSSGSGVVWNADGLILTNAHVTRSPRNEVELWDGRRFDASIASRDSRRDLAALRISTDGLEPVEPGDSSALRPGELVVAVGNPLGFAGAASTGVVHSAGRQWIRADVRLAPGNSGGPLANAHGRVIGINTAIVNGLGLAAPSNSVKEFLAHGPRPALGVSLRPVPIGLQILDVEPGGAADYASLRPGDILLGSFEDLTKALDSGRDVTRLQFLRGGNRIREAVVRLGTRAVAA